MLGFQMPVLFKRNTRREIGRGAGGQIAVSYVKDECGVIHCQQWNRDPFVRQGKRVERSRE